MKKAAIAIMVILGGLVFFGRVSALTVIPPRLEIAANPGQSITETVKIYNETDKEQSLYTSTANFSAEENEEGIPKFNNYGNNNEDDLAKWISVDAGPIVINPGESKEISFTISVPGNADPGGHYAALFFSSQSPSDISGSAGVGVASKIGVLILLRVSGDIKEDGRLVEFKLNEQKLFYDHLPVNFSLLFQNSGNVHLKPTGEIKITNMLGMVSDKILVNKEMVGNGKNILPNTSRHLEAVWTRGSIEAKDKGFFGKLNSEIVNFGLGRYNATLNLGYGTKGQVAVAAVTFWVFPWHLILVFALASVVLIFLAITAIRGYNKLIVRQALKKINSKDKK